MAKTNELTVDITTKLTVSDEAANGAWPCSRCGWTTTRIEALFATVLRMMAGRVTFFALSGSDRRDGNE